MLRVIRNNRTSSDESNDSLSGSVLPLEAGGQRGRTVNVGSRSRIKMLCGRLRGQVSEIRLGMQSVGRERLRDNLDVNGQKRSRYTIICGCGQFQGRGEVGSDAGGLIAGGN